jgi:hypothetical protein
MAIPKSERQYEEAPVGEFMHKRGELFWHVHKDQNILHILWNVTEGFSPDDLPCEDYVAKCGAESHSWSRATPKELIEGAQFISYTDALASGAKPCEECFSDEES